ncbi:galactoside ABC transporter ATP-binding protein [Shigella dysenteriae]|nr:galactoside ABC transporter ATP-binding protein [Shigella dysenteriae]
MYRETKAIFDELDIDIDPRRARHIIRFRKCR